MDQSHLRHCQFLTGRQSSNWPINLWDRGPVIGLSIQRKRLGGSRFGGTYGGAHSLVLTGGEVGGD